MSNSTVQPDNPNSDPDQHQQDEPRNLWASSHPSTTAYQHLYIDWPSMSIKKTLTISPSAPNPHPPIFDKPLAEVERSNSASCHLVTKTSPIHVILHIVKAIQDRPSTLPISVSAKTSTGAIVLNIPKYNGSIPLLIHLKSHSGNITLFLPTTFGGLVSWKSDSGTLRLSDKIQQRYKLLDDRSHKHHGIAKIVPSTASGFRADSCQIISKSGNVILMESDEQTKSDTSCLVM